MHIAAVILQLQKLMTLNSEAYLNFDITLKNLNSLTFYWKLKKERKYFFIKKAYSLFLLNFIRKLSEIKKFSPCHIENVKKAVFTILVKFYGNSYYFFKTKKVYYYFQTCERRVRNTFGLSSTEASAAAIFSTLRAFLCLTGTGTFCTVPVKSNFSTRRSIVDLLERLLCQ